MAETAAPKVGTFNRREAQYAPKMQDGTGQGPLADAWDAVTYHIKNGSVNWPMVIYMVFVHTTACLGLRACFDVQWKTLLWAFICWPISGFGITAGVHRLWSHRSYDAHWSVRLFLMLANSMANQVRHTSHQNTAFARAPQCSGKVPAARRDESQCAGPRQPGAH